MSTPMDNHVYIQGKYGLHVIPKNACATCRYSWEMEGRSSYTCYFLPYYAENVPEGTKPKCKLYKPKQAD